MHRPAAAVRALVGDDVSGLITTCGLHRHLVAILQPWRHALPRDTQLQTFTAGGDFPDEILDDFVSGELAGGFSHGYRVLPGALKFLRAFSSTARQYSGAPFCRTGMPANCRAASSALRRARANRGEWFQISSMEW